MKPTSMNNDPNDLPERIVFESNPEVLAPKPKEGVRLTERHVEQLLTIGGGLVDVAKRWADIVRIGEEGKVSVAIIQEETRKLQTALRGEIDKIMAQDKTIHTRGEAALKILTQLTVMMKEIPEADSSSRANLIDKLHLIIDGVLNVK